ncbi:DinI-like family protein [Salmonella enterica]|nr:DinI-like family protein [Salmonella enterica]
MRSPGRPVAPRRGESPFCRPRQSTKNLKSGTLQALQNEIEQRLKPHYPEIWLRIDQGSAPSVSVTGARNDKDKERILSLLEEIWQDDSWLPAA